MRSRGRRAAMAIPLGVVALAGGLALVPAPARADDRHDRGGERFERRVADHKPWRFERGRGWRFERGTGVWSPYYAWWWVDQRVVLLAAPTETVVPYPSGRYMLRGDGVGVPYYWVWIPRERMIAAPPPPAVAAPAPPELVLPGPPPPPPAG